LWIFHFNAHIFISRMQGMSSRLASVSLYSLFAGMTDASILFSTRPWSISSFRRSVRTLGVISFILDFSSENLFHSSPL
jgi:hypothetical protein